MTDSRWIRIKGIVGEAIDLAPASRPAWIEAACGGDSAVRSQVETLLEAHEQAGAFLEAPAVAAPGAATRVIEAAVTDGDPPSVRTRKP